MDWISLGVVFPRRWAWLLVLGALFAGSVTAFAGSSWMRVLGTPDGLVDPQLQDLAVLPDDSSIALVGYYVLNDTNDTDAYRYYLCRVDRHGNFVWVKNIGQSSAASPIDPEQRSLLALSDGTFLLFLHVEGGFSPDCGQNVWGCRMNAAGEIIWQNYFQLYDSYWSLKAFQTPSGRVFLTTGGGDLCELDTSTGTLLWKKLCYSPYPSPNYDYAATSLDILREEADGSLICAAYPPYFPTVEDTPFYLVKLDAQCDVLWAVRYSSNGAAQLGPLAVVPSADGGYWLYGTYYVSADGGSAGEFAGKVTDTGEELWVNRYSSWDDSTQSGLSLGFQSAIDTPLGLFVVGGGGYANIHGYHALTGTLGTDGTPALSLWYPAFSDVTNSNVLTDLHPESDGGFMALMGYTLVSLDDEGGFSATCGDPMAASGPDEPYPLAQTEGSVYTAPMDSYATCPTTVTFPDDTALYGMGQFCGDVYPGISTIKTLKGPFRLKLYGWNFQVGSRVFIDGAEVPAVKYKGPDKKTGMTVLMVKKGKTLKAMIPEGQTVSITVYNPDDKESVGFAYSR